LRLSIDPAIDKYKKENKNNKEAIVEANESEQGSKVGVAVPASELGLNNQDWQESLEYEAFTAYPYDIKESIEKKCFCTGAQSTQSMMLHHDLSKNFCESNAALTIKEFPASLNGGRKP